MKYILFFIAAVLLFSCSKPKYQVQDVRFSLKAGRVKITPIGAGQELGDTVMVVKMIRKK